MRAKCHSERSGARIFVGRSSRESHGHQELSRVNKGGRAATKSKNLSLAFYGCRPVSVEGSFLCSPGRPRPARRRAPQQKKLRGPACPERRETNRKARPACPKSRREAFRARLFSLSFRGAKRRGICFLSFASLVAGCRTLRF